MPTWYIASMAGPSSATLVVWLPNASNVALRAPTVSFIAPIKPDTAAVAGSRKPVLPDGPTVAAVVADEPFAFDAGGPVDVFSLEGFPLFSSAAETF